MDGTDGANTLFNTPPEYVVQAQNPDFLCPLMPPRHWLKKPRRREASGLAQRQRSTVLKGRREELPVTTAGNELVCTPRAQVETPTKSNKATADLKHIISEECLREQKTRGHTERGKDKIKLFFVKGSCARTCLQHSPSWSFPSTPRSPETVKSQKNTKSEKITSQNQHNALNHYSRSPPPSKREEQAVSWKQVCASGRSWSSVSAGPPDPMCSDPTEQIPRCAVRAQTVPATPAHLSLQHGLLCLFFFFKLKHSY